MPPGRVAARSPGDTVSTAPAHARADAAGTSRPRPRQRTWSG